MSTATEASPGPRLAAGTQLLGEFQDSGFEEPPYLVRRADGQVIQLPKALYAVAEALDGRPLDDVARAASNALGAGIDADGARFLIEEKLQPLGLVETGQAPVTGDLPVAHADPMLALQLKMAVIPPRWSRAIASVFAPLFHPVIVVAVLAGFVAFDVWLFGSHGVGAGARQLLYEPLHLVGLITIVVVATALHEIGHAAAARYGGAEPGAMGAGLYVVWPVFYTDVSDSYRLDRRGRVRTDLGGVYFNVLGVLGLGALYAVTGVELLLLGALVVHFQMQQQLLPLLRLDGYLILSDLTGVPDLFNRIGPTLRSLLPWRPADERVRELKPWARAVVAAWVLIVIPLLLVITALVVVNLPRLVATAWDSFQLQLDGMSAAFDDGQPLRAAAHILRAGLLLAPVVAATVTFVRLGRRAAAGVRRWSAGSTPRRALAAGGALATAAILVAAWWPSEQYEPLGPGDRWTAGQFGSQLQTAVRGDVSSAPVAGRVEAPGDDDGPATGEPAPATTTPAGAPTSTTGLDQPATTTSTTAISSTTSTSEPASTTTSTTTGSSPTTTSP